jgi:hypothetical protein
MYGRHDLEQVRRYQDELRREAENRRLVATSHNRKAPARTRRVLGLRVSFA